MIMKDQRFLNTEEKNTQKVDPGSNDQNSHKLDRQQKISLIVIAVIGIGVLVFGFWQFRSTVEIPLPKFPDNQDELSELTQDPRDESLKNVDSDQDGLSDYEETYVYETSPYLNDSDSDGYLDKEEIENGYDPNCPAGENCFGQDFDTDQAPFAEQPAAEQAQSQGAEMTPDQIRQELLKTGLVDEQTLNSIDDETLLEYYNQIINKQTEPDTMADLNQYTPDQIRQLLMENGMTAEEVNAIDDETLTQMYEESLQAAQQSQNQ